MLTYLLYIICECCRNKPKIASLLASVNFDETDAPSDAASDAAKETLQLKQQWDEVCRIVNDRSDALEEVLPLTAQFAQSKINIGDWLKATRPKVDSLEVISVDEEKMKDQEEIVKVNLLWN